MSFIERGLVKAGRWARGGGAWRVRAYCALYIPVLPFLALDFALARQERPPWRDLGGIWKHLFKALWHGDFFYWEEE